MVNYAGLAVQGLKSSMRLMTPVQKDFSSRVPVEFSRGQYTVKTVESRRELLQVYKLRYDVFHREYKHKLFPFGIDCDRYDQHADHLAIIDQRLGKVVGTYRLVRGTRMSDFYSASEFNISTVLDYPGGHVELSRACIHKSYRNGVVIGMLWRGICEYIATCGARWLFGMGSVKSTDPAEIAEVYAQLQKEGYTDSGIVIPAHNSHAIDRFQSLVDSAQTTDASAAKVPPLIRSYLKAGARIGTDVALDMDFQCADLFVVLDMQNMTESFSRKYRPV